MKKLLPILLIILTIFSFSSCSKGSGSTSSGSTASGSSRETNAKLSRNVSKLMENYGFTKGDNSIPSVYEITDYSVDGAPIIRDSEDISYYLDEEAGKAYEIRSLSNGTYFLDAEEESLVPLKKTNRSTYDEEKARVPYLQRSNFKEINYKQGTFTQYSYKSIPVYGDSLIILENTESISLKRPYEIAGVSIAEGNTNYDFLNNALYDTRAKSLVYFNYDYANTARTIEFTGLHSSRPDGLPAEFYSGSDFLKNIYGDPVGLGSYSIIEGIREIEANALFAYGNVSLTIPSTMEKIDVTSFAGVEGYMTVNIAESGNEHFVKEGDSFYDSEKTILYRGGKSTQSIADTVKVIAPRALFANYPGFYASRTVKVSSVPSSVEEIYEEAFIRAGVTNADLSNVKHLGKRAFYLSSIDNLVLPKNVETIAEMAFADAYIKNITFPEGAKEIGEKAFSGTSITSGELIIPETVEKIGRRAFAQTNVKRVVIPSGVTEIPNGAFYDSNVEEIVIPSTVVSIGNSAFASCDNLERITLPEGLKTIGDEAFSGCTGLKEINIPDSVESIGNIPFRGCSANGLSIKIKESSPVYSQIEMSYKNNIAPSWL